MQQETPMGPGQTPMGPESDQKMFQLMKKALQKARSLKEECYFLIGEIRSGKSTSFNWLTLPSVLIGGDNQVDPIYLINEDIKSKQIIAEVRNSLVSVTMIPNVKEIQEDKISLVDLPGNKDTRGEVEVMMVSFIMNSCFQYAKRARFIIVISDSGFKATRGTQFIDAIISFVRMFSSPMLEEIDVQKVFNSVALLITGVKVEEGKYPQTKEYYCRLLRQYLPKLTQLKNSYLALGQIFPLVEMLLKNLIQTQRLQIFPRAKYNQLAEKSQILEKFQKSNWQTLEMTKLYSVIEFPYAIRYLELQEYQRQNLQQLLRQKLYSYDRLAMVLTGFIQQFFADPLSFDEETFTHNYNDFKQFLLEHSSDYIQQPQDLDDQIDCEQSSIVIIKNLLKLNNFTFEITYDEDRSEQSKNQKAYISYLKEYFIQSLEIFKESFAATQNQRSLFNRAINELGQVFDYFIFICNIDRAIVSEAHQRLKEACCVMNGANLSDFEIKKTYFTFLKQENITQDQFQLGEIEEMIKFVEGQKPEDYENELIYEVRFKLYQISAKKYKDQRQFRSSLQAYLFCLINAIKVECLQNFKLKNNISKAEELLKLIQQTKDSQQRVFKDIKDVIFEVDPSKQIDFLESYLKFCDNTNNIQEAYNVAERLTKNKEMKSPKYRDKLKHYKEKKLEMEQKRNQLREKSDGSTIPIPKDYISTINFLLGYFFQHREISLEEIEGQTQNLYKLNQQQLQHKNEFVIDLPPQMTNYDIIAYSRHLISKINKRKTIILLGKKTGKSTAAYWLRGKELVKRGNNICSNSKEPNRIIDSFINHTEVPNMYTLNEEQILIDCPHMYEKDPEKLILTGTIMKEIIESSSACKFILVVKQSDILQNQSKELIQRLIAYISMWEGPKEQFFNSLHLLLTFQRNNINRVREALKTANQLFISINEKNSELIKQKYNIELNEELQKELSLLLNHIYMKALYLYLNLDDVNYKKKTKMIDLFSQNWKYVSLQDKKLALEHFFPLHLLKDTILEKFLCEVGNNIIEIQNIGSTLRSILEARVDEYKNSGHFSDELSDDQIKLQGLIGPKSLERASLLVENKQLKTILYPKMNQFKAITHESVKDLLVYRSLKKSIQITSKLGQSVYGQAQQSFDLLCLKSLDVSMPVLAANRARVHLFEACRMKIYQLFQSWRLHGTASLGRYNHIVFSEKIVIAEKYELANSLPWVEMRSWPIQHFSIEVFKKEANKQEALNQLFSYLTQNVRQDVNILLQECQFKHPAHSQKLQLMFMLFEEQSKDNYQTLMVLHTQALVDILIADRIQDHFEKEALQYKLKIQLASIFEKIILNMVAVDLQLADKMAQWYRDPKTTRAFFERKLELTPPTEKPDALRQCLNCLIELGHRNNEIYNVVMKYSSLLSPQERQLYQGKMYQESVRQNPEQSKLFVEIESVSSLTIQEFQYYLYLVKEKLDAYRHQKEINQA